MFTRVRFVVSIIIFMIICGLFSSRIKAEEKKSSEDTSPLIIEELWFVFQDEPFGYFLDARASFLRGDLEDAAHNIRKGVAIIKLETQRATGEEKKDLTHSSNRLKKLA